LSHFLNRGIISEYLKRSGKIPDDNDLLHMRVRGDLMNGELIFNTLVCISSYPWDFFNLRDLIIFSISLVDKHLSLMFGKGFVKVCSK
jgi:hypothetical protein